MTASCNTSTRSINLNKLKTNSPGRQVCSFCLQSGGSSCSPVYYNEGAIQLTREPHIFHKSRHRRNLGKGQGSKFPPTPIFFLPKNSIFGYWIEEGQKKLGRESEKGVCNLHSFSNLTPSQIRIHNTIAHFPPSPPPPKLVPKLRLWIQEPLKILAAKRVAWSMFHMDPQYLLRTDFSLIPLRIH
jgi:hypothetical protein